MAAWICLVFGLIFGIYLGWLITRGPSRIGNRALGSVIIAPGVVALLVYGGLVYVSDDDGLEIAVALCTALGGISAWIAAPGTKEVLRARIAWLFVPVVFGLGWQADPTKFIALNFGSLLMPLGFWLTQRYGRQGLAVIAVGTLVVVRGLWLGHYLPWELNFWPWPWGTLAIAFAAGVVYFREVAAGVERWTVGWLAPFLIALALHSEMFWNVTDSLSLALNFELVLRGLAFWVGLHAAANVGQMHRAASGLVVASLLLCVAHTVLPPGSSWLGSASSHGLKIGLATSTPLEIIWYPLLMSLGVLMSGNLSAPYRSTISRLWSNLYFLISLMLMTVISLKVTYGASGEANNGNTFYILRTIPEMLPIAAFVAGYLRGHLGLIFTLMGSMLIVTAQLLAILNGSIVAGSVLQISLGSQTIDVAMPFIAMLLAWIGSRTGKLNPMNLTTPNGNTASEPERAQI